MITVHHLETSRSQRVLWLLEEMGLPYSLHHVRINDGEHQQPEFLALNPHGRIPVLIDRATGITLFEAVRQRQ